MNRCEELQNKILAGVSLSPEEKIHLSSCQECCNTAAFLKRMERLPALEQAPPSRLDELLLQTARPQKRFWIPQVWKVGLSAAAAFAFAAGVLFYQTAIKTPSAVPSVAVTVPESSFEDQVFSLAMEVGSGVNTFSETMDLVI